MPDSVVVLCIEADVLFSYGNLEQDTEPDPHGMRLGL